MSSLSQSAALAGDFYVHWMFNEKKAAGECLGRVEVISVSHC